MMSRDKQRCPPPPWSSLPDDATALIGRHAAATLLRMEAVCKTWRAALSGRDEEMWKPLALARFPRLRDLLKLSPAAMPTFRALYRRQLDAERTTTPILERRTTALSDFIFTVEFTCRDEVRRWTGCFSRIDENLSEEAAVMADGSFPRLWSSADTPFTDAELDVLTNADGSKSQRQAMCADFRLVIFVTHNLQTVKLYDGDVSYHTLDEAFGYNDDEEDRPVCSFDFLEMPCRPGMMDVLQQLHNQRHGYAASADEEREHYGLFCRFAPSLGAVNIRFKTGVSFTALTTDDLHQYLEHAVPWPISDGRC